MKSSKCLIDKNGRECISCWIYKTRDNFSKDKKNNYGYTCNCKACRNLSKQRYRNTPKGIESIKRDRDIRRCRGGYKRLEKKIVENVLKAWFSFGIFVDENWVPFVKIKNKKSEIIYRKRENRKFFDKNYYKTFLTKNLISDFKD